VTEEDKTLKLYFTDFIERYEQEVKPLSFATIEEVNLKLQEYVKEKMPKGVLTEAAEQGGG